MGTASVTMPLLFVFLWSTGFIGAKLGLPFAEPFTFLAVRFALVTGVLMAATLFMRPRWPREPVQWCHAALAGLLIHGMYLGGVFVGLHHGVSAGVCALIVGTQPLLTATVVGRLFGERVSPRQWIGLAMGLIGVTLVIWHRLDTSGTEFAGFALCVAALLGITLGTLYQKRFVGDFDLTSSALIQYGAAAVLMACLAFAFETRVIDWTGEFLFALLWLSLVLSLGAVFLLYILIRRHSAAGVTCLFYLVPPVTTLLAFVVFGEALGAITLLGMAIAAAAVALVNLQTSRLE